MKNLTLFKLILATFTVIFVFRLTWKLCDLLFNPVLVKIVLGD